MNYPSVIVNPFLKPKPEPFKVETIGFSNLKRPQSAPFAKVQQPFTQRLELLKNSANYKKILENTNGSSSEHRPFSASVRPNTAGTNNTFSTINVASTIATTDFTKSNMSTGVLTTAKYEEKAKIIEQTNNKCASYSNVMPLYAHLGEKKEGFDRRKVKQLDDIVYDDEFEEPEDVKCLYRLPSKILTEDSLKQTLTPYIEKLSLENHHWVRDNFLDKVGRLAPNLSELSLRGLNITNNSFKEIIKYCNSLKNINISQCTMLTEEAIVDLPKRCPSLSIFVAIKCKNAITDMSLSNFKDLQGLQVLDISYCNEITDAALISLSENPNICLNELYLSGLEKITNIGIVPITKASKETLEILELEYLDQEGVNDQCFQGIAFCHRLHTLSLSGTKHIGDEGIYHLMGSKDLETTGLLELKTLKLNCLERLNDICLAKIVAVVNKIEVLELTKCQNLTEYSMGMVFKNLSNLKKLEINNIPGVSISFVNEMRISRPHISIIRYANQQSDVKDTGLRVPIPFKTKKKKKKKKKVAKKKK